MEISQFYDVNKRTQTEQVLKNMQDIAELKDADDTLQENIDAEEQARTDADSILSDDIADLQHQIDSLGNVFTLKGSVASYGNLPAVDNNIGDVWYVEDEAVGYVWIDDNGTERWEQLGMPIDLSDYVTSTDLATALDDYQEKLTAGTNISIIGNTISATQPDVSGLGVLTGITAPSTSTQGAVGQLYLDTTTKILYECTAENSGVYTWDKVGGTAKQDKLTAGTNITIDADNVISASGISGNPVLLDNSDQTFSGDKKLIINNGKNFNLQIGANGSFQVGYGSNYFKFDLVNGEAKFYGSGNKMLIYRSLLCGLSVNKGSGIYYLEFPNRTTTGTIACVDDITSKVPDAPTTDGTYTLKVVVSNGVPTYQWVA